MTSRSRMFPLRASEESARGMASICIRGVQMCLGAAQAQAQVAARKREREEGTRCRSHRRVLLVDFLFFHDIYKAGEAVTFAQYLTGVLSIPVLVVSSLDLLRRHLDRP